MPVIAAIELPAVAGYGIVLSAVLVCLVYVARWVYRDRQLASEYHRPPTAMEIPVAVRGPDGAPLTPAELLRFAECWHWAIECLARYGPWSRPLLRARLLGNKVQVMPLAPWLGAGPGAGMVGGEVVAGVIRVGPDLSALAHEFAHRCEAVMEHGETDNSHTRWRVRGLAAADEAYRDWLAARP